MFVHHIASAIFMHNQNHRRRACISTCTRIHRHAGMQTYTQRTHIHKSPSCDFVIHCCCCGGGGCSCCCFRYSNPNRKQQQQQPKFLLWSSVFSSNIVILSRYCMKFFKSKMFCPFDCLWFTINACEWVYG